ncbi:UNVERIFIED_CONTAM: hypothetical protein Sangu_2882000 [Sesamum angustifolium]|uniref:Pectinesterase inhibitor domain-containing protein n=1 Tax=Sesamum angustifolium TaxID=2727405 RepID=A0AAW2IP25_9LAMI
MAILRSSVPVLITFSVLSFFLTYPPPLLSATAADGTELATEVCRNTTSFAFCHDAIYSDPRAPDADRYVLSYIAFGKAYSNATDTRDYITSKIKSGGGKPETLRGLKKCLGYYEEAVRILVRCWATWIRRRFRGWINCRLRLKAIHALARSGLEGGRP